MNRPHDSRSAGPSTKRSRRRARDPGRSRGQTRSWATEAAIVGAARLLLRGREAEARGDVETAVGHYTDALTIPEAERHPADTGALFHHLGNCTSLMGDKHSAWEFYLGAARFIHGHADTKEMGECALSAPLCEAGMLLVDIRPPSAIREEISHAILLGGVADAINHTVRVLLGEALPSVGSAMEAHRRLTGLMVLAGYAGADVTLEKGALALYNRVVLPFEERHPVGPGAPMGNAKAFAIMFIGLARVFEAVGRQERPDRAGVPPTREEVEALRLQALLAFPGAPRPLMSHWLGTYLRDRHGAAWATDEILVAAAGQG
ncbi:MAG: hypothetical protein ACRYGP_22150 [Janthinobacterium lividum]